MSLLWLGDPHLQASAPTRRVDDFVAVLFDKLDQVLSLAQQYAVRAIICPGDLFNKPTPPFSLLVRAFPFFLKLKELGIEFITVPGNHDVFGNNLSTLPNTAFGVLAESGFIVCLQPDVPYRLRAAAHDGAGDLVIAGHSYFDKRPVIDPRTCGDPEDVFLLVSHSMVLEDKLYREQEDFTYAHQLAEKFPGWDGILCGHYHYRFVVRAGDTLIANPGAMVRVKASRGDMDLAPGVFIVDVDRPFRIIASELLRTRPASEVFSKTPEAFESQNPGPDRIGEFIDEVAGTDASSEYSLVLGDILEQEIERSGCSSSVADLVRKYIAKAEQKIAR